MMGENWNSLTRRGAAIARQWCNESACNNKETVGSGVLYAVCVEAI
jgi:hypothetical protein